eukprot:576807-Hanusia_phi.AAC.1
MVAIRSVCRLLCDSRLTLRSISSTPTSCSSSPPLAPRLSWSTRATSRCEDELESRRTGRDGTGREGRTLALLLSRVSGNLVVVMARKCHNSE